MISCSLQLFRRPSGSHAAGRKKKALVVMLALTPGHLQSVFSGWISISVNFSPAEPISCYSFHCCRGQHRKSSCSIKVWEWRKVSLGLYILDDGENTAASWAVVLNQKYNASFACNVEIWGANHCSYSLQLSHMETFNVMCVQIWFSIPFEFVRSTRLTDFWHAKTPKRFLLLKSDRSNEHHWQPSN